LIILFVYLTGKKLPPEYVKSLEQHRALTKELGGQFLEVEALDIAGAIVKVAKEKRVTQIVVGESLREPGLFSFLKPALPYQIFQKTQHIDVYIVATGRE
jgi:K+-sensing histidine kinase KdpD